MSIRCMTRKQLRDFLDKQIINCELLYRSPREALYLNEDETTLLLHVNHRGTDIVYLLNVNASYKDIDNFLSCVDVEYDDIYNVLNLISAMLKVLLDNRKYDVNHYE